MKKRRLIMSTSDYKVAIVGAGPVGLLSALRLSDFGINCVVFEAESLILQDLRASTFHPPTLEILKTIGVVDALIAEGRICKTWQIRLHPDNEYVEFDLGILKDDTSYPYRLQVEQSKLCEILLKKLNKRENVEVKFNHKLIGLSQSADNVTLELETPDGPKVCKSEFVIGADGARSQVRKSLNLPFEGQTYPETTILATTKFPFEKYLPNLSGINYVWKKEGTFSLLHLPKIWRCSLYPDPDESIESALTPESIERKLQKIVPRKEAYDVEDVRPYRIHKRIVDNYRSGRVVLAGDAAHINSPSGGMGMNGGLHDGWFLTEALNDVFKGEPIERLDLYTRQRRPVAFEQILKQSDNNRKRMQERNPEKRREMFNALQKIVNDKTALHKHLRKTSMIEGWRASVEAE